MSVAKARPPVPTCWTNQAGTLGPPAPTSQTRQPAVSPHRLRVPKSRGVEQHGQRRLGQLDHRGASADDEPARPHRLRGGGGHPGPPDPLAAHVPFGALLTVHDGGLGNPISLPAGGAAHEAARDALREAWEGVESVNIGLGGSIPFIAEFQRLFPDASVLVTGVEDPDSREQDGDESLDMAMFARASLPAAGS